MLSIAPHSTRTLVVKVEMKVSLSKYIDWVSPNRFVLIIFTAINPTQSINNQLFIF